MKEEEFDKIDDELSKDLIGILIVNEYFEYCKVADKIEQKLFEHQGELITTRQAQKILESLRDQATEEKDLWRPFLRKISKIALTDKEFNEYREDQFTRCEECDYAPIKIQKISHHHTEWKKNAIDDNEEPYIVNQHYCPMCNHTFYTASGIDKNPEQGLK